VNKYLHTFSTEDGNFLNTFLSEYWRRYRARYPVSLDAIQHCQNPLEWFLLFAAKFSLPLGSTDPIQSELGFPLSREMRPKCECDHAVPSNGSRSLLLLITGELSSTGIRTQVQCKEQSSIMLAQCSSYETECD
jgi:hypothetical protein